MNLSLLQLNLVRKAVMGTLASLRARRSPCYKRFVSTGLALLSFAIFANPVQANSSDFESANTLYEQQKFTEAAAAYHKVLESGTVAPHVFFNLGNAHFKTGEFGKAIAAYRSAQKLAPRDPDTRANLRLAREKVQNTGASAPEESFLQRLTSNEWILLASVPFMLCFLLLAFSQIKRDWKKMARISAAVLGCLALLFGIAATVSARHEITKSAVVTSDEAVVRHGPFPESQSAFSLREGAELTVLDQRQNWVQVSASVNKIGWVRANQVTVIN